MLYGVSSSIKCTIVFIKDVFISDYNSGTTILVVGFEMPGYGIDRDAKTCAGGVTAPE